MHRAASTPHRTKATLRTHKTNQTPKKALAIALHAALVALYAPIVGIAQTPANGATPVLLATLSLPEITVSGTRTPNSVDDVAATVTVIPAATIERRLARDIRELTRYEPNVSVGNSVTRFGLTGINIRGIEGNRILLQVDGARLPDSFSIGSFASSTRNSIEPDLLKSAEIVRGPASSLYGSDALGGVVSFFTKDPADLLRETSNEIHASLKTSASQADRERSTTGTLALGRDLPVQVLVSATRRDGHETTNFGTLDTRGANRTAPNPQNTASSSALGKLVWNTDAGGPTLKFTVDSLDATTKTDVATLNNLAPKTTSLLATDRSKRARFSADLEWNQLGFIDTLRANAYQQNSKTRQVTNERRDATTAGCSGVTTNTNTCLRDIEFAFDQTLKGLGLQAVKRLELGTSVHRVSAGFDYTDTRFLESRDGKQTIITATGATTVSNTVGSDVFPVRDFPPSQSKQTGFYLQDEISLLDGAISVTPGWRFDSFKLTPENDAVFAADNVGVAVKGLSDRAVSPRLGVLWKALPQATLYGQYAQGFRAPPYSDVNFGFTNFAFGYTAIPNADLKPERSKGFEFGLRGNAGALNYNLTAFNNRYEDFISSLTQLSCPGDARCSAAVPITFQSINLGRVKISGWEAKLNWQLANVAQGLKLNISVGESKGDNLIDNTPLDSISPRRSVIGLQFDAPSKAYGVEAILTHYAAKTRVASATQYQPSAAAVMDVFAYWNPTKWLQLNASIANLADKKYWLWSDVRGLSSTSAVLDRTTQASRNASFAIKFTY